MAFHEWSKSMEYRCLGRSGLKISSLVLGTMNFGNPTSKEESIQIIDRAFETGINLFDCADVYAGGESEKILGEALARNGKRKEVFVTSKVFMRTGPGPNDLGNTKHHIINSCEESLRRSKTDYIDIELDEPDLRFCDTLVPPGTYVSNHFNTSNWMK
jgi:aryl-alcohol dehydrogenase-like predicted oxidoreductase